MSSLLGQMLPLAVATVLSPLVLVSLFVLLGGDGPTRRGTIFVAGLVTAVGVTEVVSAFVLNGTVDEGSTVDSGISWFNVALGLFELALGVVILVRGKEKSDQTNQSLLAKLDHINPMGVFLLGVAVPTYPAAISAGTALVRSNQNGGGRAVGALVYIVIVLILVGVPVLYVALRGAEAQGRISRANKWVLAKTSTVGAWALIVIGIYLVINAISVGS
jgi:Sap, sulfolipid-1-addressing protein